MSSKPINAILSARERQRFEDMLWNETVKQGTLQRLITSTFDTRQARAWSAIDERRIREEIEKLPGGFVDLNNKVSIVRVSAA